MILIAKRNGSLKAIDLRVLKILEMSEKHLWIALSEYASEGIMFKQTLSEEEQRTLFEFLLRNKDKDEVYDIDELVEAVKEVKSDGQAVNAIQ
jgi:hypothetical protein